MPHPRSHMTKVIPRGSRLQTATQILTLISTLFVIATPLVYIDGRAYHDGWFQYLKLDDRMFPLDTAGTLTLGAQVIRDFFSLTRDTLVQAFAVHTLWSFVVFFAIGSAVHLLLQLTKVVLKMRAAQATETTRSDVGSRDRWFFLVAPYVGIGASVSLIYLFVFAMTIFFGLVLTPFNALGRYEAKHFAVTQFKDFPSVTLKGPDGIVRPYRELACGPQFCALWANGHAAAVPLSAIVWLEASPPTPNGP